jgi:hypothetical protein
LNRLKKVLEPSGRLTEHKYDAAGNREKEVVSFAAEILTESIYKYNAMNWLQTVTKTDYAEGDERTQIIKYSYDINGNQTRV